MQARHLDNQLRTHFKNSRETLILLGARQVGKTTILQKIFPQAESFSLDNESTRSILERYDISAYKQLIRNPQSTVIIDEIQELSDPGRAAKIIYDQLPSVRLIVTGSSALNIKNKTSESLAGRKIDYHLYPLTLSEYLVQQNLEPELSLSLFTKLTSSKNMQHTSIIKPYDHQALLSRFLLFGGYPAILNNSNSERYLNNMVDSVILKDLLDLKLLEEKRAALSLLKLLAHQIGNLINYAELAGRLEIDQRTVKRYIELFEASYIIFRLTPYTAKGRDEIGKAPKIYFWDLGLRNALINNFAPTESRGDFGQLFENFVIADLLKKNVYQGDQYQFHYWRTGSGSEVDLVLTKHDQLLAFEIKSHNRRINRAFLSRYPHARLKVISQNNYWV